MNEALATVLGRIWADPTIVEDFHAICDCGGRFSGTASEAKARDLLADRLAAIAPVRRETVSYRGWSRGPAEVVLPEGATLEAQALVRSPATEEGGLSARLVDCGRGTPEDIARAGEAVCGAIVLVRHEFMIGRDHVHRRKKYDAARAAGAAGFLIANHVPGTGPVTGSSGDGSSGHIPCAGISHEAAARISALDGARVTLHVRGTFRDETATNLFATIAGRGDGLIVLSAHYDGHDLAESAIDNASGVACVLAAARAVAEIVPTLAHGLEVALFTVEEWALWGSAEHLAAMPEAERRRRRLNVNLDSVAGDDALTALTSGVPGLAGFLHAALAPAGLGLGIAPRYMGNSDHANYLRAGIPAFRLCAGFERPATPLSLLLTRADTRDKVHPHQLKTAASVTAAILLAACADRALPPALAAEEAARITAG
ncbi:M28 family peptidase [Elioraea rosea]|uniref:M28 family peptidase n=1 Tax=Elioraea rosea TaxID=2492390 RepID=UPI001183EC4B|nr:M28 family peptidase [Elioraea rosea]